MIFKGVLELTCGYASAAAVLASDSESCEVCSASRLRRDSARFLLWLCAALPVLFLQLALAVGASASEQPQDNGKPKRRPEVALRAQEPCKILIVGFNGALLWRNWRSSGIVRLRDRINTPEFPGACFQNFQPYYLPSAYRWVLRYFPKHGGRFTQEEIERGPKIIIVGHSLGGMSTLMLARRLGSRGIPVDLTVQVASFGFADNTVPSNVKNAANFYVHGALSLLTKKHVRVKDPSATHFYGNTLVRGFGHVSAPRAPQVSDLVIQTVGSMIAAQNPPTPGLQPADPTEH